MAGAVRLSRVIDAGFADLRLPVERPPRTLEAARLVAAEQIVLAHECLEATGDVPSLASRLLDSPVWTFWWH